ncbi:MAG: tail fiber domain-containing protein [Flavobacteriales bacterium]|nr:tail fiber domain-containing protein [Flavobacteriales bacterium]
MKRISTLFVIVAGVVSLILVSRTNEVKAQAVSINSNGAAPNVHSILDVSSTTSGVLLPRMTTGERTTLGNTPLGNAEKGMTVFDTQLNAYFYWNGITWVRILSATGASLDAAYDAGGAGLGRTITADEGAVVITGTGTGNGTGIALDVDGGIKVAEDKWIGIGSTDERFVFDGTGNLIGLKAADLTIDDGNWIGVDATSPRFVFDGTNDEVELMNSEFGIGIQAPTNLLHVYIEQPGEVVLGKFENNATNSLGTTAGLKIVGDRGQPTNEVAFIEFDNNNGASTLARITTKSLGNGQFSIQLGDGSGGLVERMVLDNAGNLQLDGLIEATSSVVTSTAAGVLQSLPIGSNNDVLKISGGAITWGPASVSSLAISALTGGTSGDILYNNAGTWTVLTEPSTPGSYALTTPGNGAAPSWQATTALTVTGDDLGNHTATENIKLATFAIEASDGIVNIDDNLTINGKVVSLGINETSDVRFKKNIEGITDALSTVLKLEGVTYNWRTEDFPEKEFSTEREYGVIAQQIEKFIPELVHTDADGYKSVQYSHMVPLLIEAIKEQNALLSNQDSEIAKLKASVESLSDYLNTSKK